MPVAYLDFSKALDSLYHRRLTKKITALVMHLWITSVSKEQDIKGGPLSAEGIIHSGVFLGSVFLPNH